MSRSLAAGMPTRDRASTQRRRTVESSIGSCARIASTIWASNPQDRVQGHHRVLEDHRDLLAPDAPPRRLVLPGEVSAPEADRSILDSAGRVDQAHQREPGHRLAGAGFADQAQDFAPCGPRRTRRRPTSPRRRAYGTRCAAPRPRAAGGIGFGHDQSASYRFSRGVEHVTQLVADEVDRDDRHQEWRHRGRS